MTTNPAAAANAATGRLPARRGPLAALRHRDFRRIWIANVVSDMGTWMQLVTVATIVARRTGSALETGLVAVATFGPQALSAPIAGVMADRFERRSLYLKILCAQTIGATVLAVAIGHGAAPHTLTLIVLGQGLVGSMANPVAAAILPELVPREDLLAASSLSSVSWNAGRIAGPMAAAASVAAFGPTWSIAGNAVSFAVLFVSVHSIKRRFPPHRGDDAGFFKRLRAGASALRRSRTCTFAFQASMASQFLIGPFIGLIPFYAREVLRGGQNEASILYVAMGIGALTGSLAVTTVVARIGRPRAVVGQLAAAIMVLIGLAYAPGRVSATFGLALFGFLYIPSFVGLTSVLPRDSPPAARGRISSLFSACIGTAYSSGVVCMGALADRTSMRTALLAGSSILTVLLGISVIALNSRWRSLGIGDPASRRAVRAGLAARSS